MGLFVLGNQPTSPFPSFSGFYGGRRKIRLGKQLLKGLVGPDLWGAQPQGRSSEGSEAEGRVEWIGVRAESETKMDVVPGIFTCKHGYLVK